MGTSAAGGRLLLVERDAQLEILRGALDGATRGEGSVVVVCGPAGIGKTSLLIAARDDAAGRGLRVLRARGSELERAFTFGVVRSLVEGPLRRASSQERARVLVGAAAPAAVALGLDTRPGVMVEASAALLNALYWVIADLCDDEPLVLVVDDAQWADAPSLRALAFLANRVDALALTLIVGVRDGEACEDPEALGALRCSAVVVKLEALSVRAVRQVVEARSATPLDDEAVAALHRATAGNPLWTAQAAAILAQPDASVGPKDGQAWSSPALSAVVLGRLARMTPAAQAVARAVAVLGDATAPRHVAELAGVGTDEVLAAAGELTAAGLLDDASELVIAHPLVREAVLRDGGEHARSLANQRAARMLRAAGAPVERIAGHLLRTVPDADPENVADLMAAAADAMRRGSPSAALGYLERAAAEPPDAAADAGVQAMRGFAEFKLARFGDAAAHLTAAAGVADADVDVVIAHAAATSYVGGGDEELVVSFLEASARQSDPEHRLLITACSAITSWWQTRRWLPAIELPAPETLAALSSAERAALAAHTLFLSDAGDLGYAADVGARALGDGRMIAERPSLVIVTLGPFCVLLWAGRVDDFDREAAHVDALAQATASSEPTHLLSMLRLQRHLLGGDLPAALATYATMQRFGAGVPGAANHPIAHLSMASQLEVLLAHDGPQAADAARVAFLASTDLSVLPPFYSRWGLAAQALVHLACGRIAEALAAAEDHAEFVRRHGGFALPASWHTALPLARLATGDRAGALQAAEDFLAREQIHDIPERIATALRILARIESDRAVELLTEAIALHPGGCMRLEHATAHLELGVALRRDGKRATAREALQRGADIATACQANVLASRAREELKILGARPRRLAFSGIDSLTASERRIADLAATGPTNREIAQQLYLTRKTVENHLSNVYRKLDIGSRDQLGAVLAGASANSR